MGLNDDPTTGQQEPVGFSVFLFSGLCGHYGCLIKGMTVVGSSMTIDSTRDDEAGSLPDKRRGIALPTSVSGADSNSNSVSGTMTPPACISKVSVGFRPPRFLSLVFLMLVGFALPQQAVATALTFKTLPSQPHFEYIITANEGDTITLTVAAYGTPMTEPATLIWTATGLRDARNVGSHLFDDTPVFDPAEVDVDLLRTSGTVIIPPGTNSTDGEFKISAVDFTVTINNDADDEPAEQLLIELSLGPGAYLPPHLWRWPPQDSKTSPRVALATHHWVRRIVRIQADPSDTETATVNISGARADEDDGNATFMVTLNQAVSSDVVLDITYSDGTADVETDLDRDRPDTVTIDGGKTSANFNVPIINDDIPEVNETFTVTISENRLDGVTIADGEAEGVIVDNDSVTLSPILPLPDLTVDTVRVTRTAASVDTSFTISATVRNSGKRDAAGTTLRYYRSADNSITTDDTLLATDPVSTLAPGATSAESAVVSIANTGSYWVGACVSTVSGETEADNNCSTGVSVTVTAAPVTAPDLTVGGVSVSQSSVEAGTSFTINATARNSGDEAAPASTLRYYRSANSTITTNDTQLATDPVSALVPGATSPESAAVSIPNTGSYWVGACVSTVGGETERGNNCSSGVEVTVTAAPVTAPDLTVDSVRVSQSSVEAGASFTINATARNSGNGAADATTLSYYRSTDSTITANDTELTTDTIDGLAPDGFSAESATISIADIGEYWVGACVDTVDDETAVGNNCSSGVQVTVTAPALPDLTVDNVGVSDAAPEAGASFTINATVRNLGTEASPATTLRYYRSDDDVIGSAADTELATESVAGLAIDASSLHTAEVAISATGNYWVGVCVDTVSEETAADNNCSSGMPVTITAPVADNDGMAALPAIIQLLLEP